ncbi:hypothetical protein OS493_012416 [Desmophyllum pertusum]|uniref:Uncharacterized protein n=1 Tax=Desmophyllum pertusum TaxID=174260 RepID=A0A9W9ZU87_9CNID|nr:hypothetical protein OS493_012416 [Desmophyllum pertusum]
MNKLLLLSILACLVILASSMPTLDDKSLPSRERRSPCGSACAVLKGVKFGGGRKKKVGGWGSRRPSGKSYRNRFRNSRGYDFPDDDNTDNE